MATLTLDIGSKQAPIRDGVSSTRAIPSSLPAAKASHKHPSSSTGDNNASLFFVGTATTILEWEGLRLMTDPNFLHAGDHVHLGPGVTGTRRTNPAVELDQLPNVDAVLLSHYHADHFDQEVEARLRRDLPIITTPHARDHLSNKGDESFTSVHSLGFWERLSVNFSSNLPHSSSGSHGSDPPSQPISQTNTTGALSPCLHVTGMPGKHVPPGVLSIANDILGAVPPVNGWMLELGYSSSHSDADLFKCGYRIYISGDTLLIDDLKQIPKLYKHAGKDIDLMLIHLGGTTIPGPSMPLLMVTMDAKQGIELVKLIQPELTIPIHYDDYDVFLSPLSDFKKEVSAAGLETKVVYLDRGDEFEFTVRKS